MSVRSFVLALSLCLFAAPASAHGPAPGPNGGQVQDLAGGHVEVTAKDNEIRVYLFDAADKPIAAQGVVGTATVLAQGRQAVVALQPAEGNVLRGTGSFLAQPGLKVVISVTLPGQRPQLGRYAPLG